MTTVEAIEGALYEELEEISLLMDVRLERVLVKILAELRHQRLTQAAEWKASGNYWRQITSNPEAAESLDKRNESD